MTPDLCSHRPAARAFAGPLAAITLLLTIGTSGLARADWPHAPWMNVRIAPTTSVQTSHQVIPDGAGGVIVAW